MDADLRHPRPKWLAPASSVGLLVAAIFFGLSVTPSMVPRGPEMQGVLGGGVAAIGYMMWWLVARLLVWLGLGTDRALP